MSDSTTVNNQARPSMASPLILTAGGIGLGLWKSPFVKSDYKGTEKLVQLDKDTFQTEIAAHKDELKDDAKPKFEKLETARAEYADGDKDLKAFLDENPCGVAAETNFQPEGGEKSISLLEKDVADAENAVKVSENETVKVAQKELDDLAEDASAEVKKAAADKLEAAKKAAVDENEAVKTARKAVADAKAERYNAIEKAIADKGDDALKDMLAEKKDVMKKINEGTLKDFNFKDIKKILPKAKGLGAVVYGAIGLVLGSIIARAVANGKNQA